MRGWPRSHCGRTPIELRPTRGRGFRAGPPRRQAPDLDARESERRRAPRGRSAAGPGTTSSSRRPGRRRRDRAKRPRRPGRGRSRRRRSTPREARRSASSRRVREAASLPAHEEREPVGQALDVAELVRREEDRLSLAPPALDEAVEGAEAVGIERRGRLVEEEHGRVGQHARPRGRGAGPCRPNRSPTARSEAPFSDANRKTSAVRAGACRAGAGRTRRPRGRSGTRETRPSAAGTRWRGAPPGRPRPAGLADEDLARGRRDQTRRRPSASSSCPSRSGPSSATTSPALDPERQVTRRRGAPP